MAYHHAYELRSAIAAYRKSIRTAISRCNNLRAGSLRCFSVVKTRSVKKAASFLVTEKISATIRMRKKLFQPLYILTPFLLCITLQSLTSSDPF